jgi:hypothetical protein
MASANSMPLPNTRQDNTTCSIEAPLEQRHPDHAMICDPFSHGAAAAHLRFRADYRRVTGRCR